MYTVLLVDDEQIEIDFLKQIFSKRLETYKVVGEAKDGAEAVRLAAIHEPDIVIMDVRMPEKDGLIAAKEMKEIIPQLTIVLNSAHADFEFARKALDCHVSAYLLKPSDEESITSTIEKAVSQNPYSISSTVTPLASGDIEKLYAMEDKIIEAIALSNIPLMNKEFASFVDFFKQSSYSINNCRMFFLNLILNTFRALSQKDIPKPLLSLVNSNFYIIEISSANTWSKVIKSIELYIAQINTILETSGLIVQKCSDAVERYIRLNYNKKISLNQLSEEFHFTAAYISRVFKKDTGLSVNAFINKCRLEKAVELLSDTNLPISEIAHQVGYDNISHFNRVFKEHMGYSPATVRTSRR